MPSVTLCAAPARTLHFNGEAVGGWTCGTPRLSRAAPLVISVSCTPSCAHTHTFTLTQTNERTKTIRVVTYVYLKRFRSFQDRHVKASPGYSVDREPEVDPSQDYQLLLGYENSTHTVLRFRRRLDTCDNHDVPITVSYVIYYVAWFCRGCKFFFLLPTLGRILHNSTNRFELVSSTGVEMKQWQTSQWGFEDWKLEQVFLALVSPLPPSVFTAFFSVVCAHAPVSCNTQEFLTHSHLEKSSCTHVVPKTLWWHRFDVFSTWTLGSFRQVNIMFVVESSLTYIIEM